MNQRYGVVVAPVSHIKPQSLEKVFKTCGTIESISFIEDNGKKIQCQIFYTTPGAANKAVKEFDGQAFLGKVVTVIRYDKESKPEDIIINSDQPKNKEIINKSQNKSNRPNECKNQNSIISNDQTIQYQANDLNEEKNTSANNDQDHSEEKIEKKNENSNEMSEDRIPIEFESSRFYNFGENVKKPKDDSEKSRRKKSKHKSESSTTDSYSSDSSSSSDYSSDSNSDSNSKKKKSHHHHSHKKHHHKKSHHPRHHHHHHHSRTSKH